MASLDVDTYLNRIVPRPRFDVLPRFASHFLGCRKPASGSTTSNSSHPESSTLLHWLFAFLGAFIGIAIIENVYLALPKLGGDAVPTIIASFGAAAILEYNAFTSPFAQPRNLMVGHFLSTIVGVGITKLFQLLPPARFNELRWLAGALSVATASTVMSLTKTVYPPAGATTLLIATMAPITELGWWLLPLILLGSSLMLVSAMLMNNLYACFPTYWWTSEDLTPASTETNANDVEKANNDSTSNTGSASSQQEQNTWRTESVSDADTVTNGRSSDIGSQATGHKMQAKAQESTIRISSDDLIFPEWMEVSEHEREMLEMFQTRLRHGVRSNV